MSLTAEVRSEPRWTRTLRGSRELADDLGVIGTWVGPRTGPHRRDQGQKEDYVLRRLLVAWKECGALGYPTTVRAERERPGEPDFVLTSRDGDTLGVEVSEAGEEDYQAWLTRTDRSHSDEGGEIEPLPFEASTPRTVAEIERAIRSKARKFDEGCYQSVDACDLLVYDNTSWGAFLDTREILEALTRPNDLAGRFREVHMVFGETVYLDVLGSGYRQVDVTGTYEIDYAGWVADQVERLRQGRDSGLDWAHIAEEIEDLGKSERRALASHLRRLVAHLLKWEYQSSRRSNSWKSSIADARDDLSEILMENPSLKGDLAEQRVKEYKRARRIAAGETGLDEERFPDACPYGLEEIVDPEFFPQARGTGS